MRHARTIGRRRRAPSPFVDARVPCAVENGQWTTRAEPRDGARANDAHGDDNARRWAGDGSVFFG